MQGSSVIVLFCKKLYSLLLHTSFISNIPLWLIFSNSASFRDYGLCQQVGCSFRSYQCKSIVAIETLRVYSNYHIYVHFVMRAAVITPYYKEETSILERCHRSVLDQDYECTHFMVADGFPSPEVDGWHCDHIKLSKPHNDNGNTPRAIGCLSAMNQGYNIIFLLDADNWLMRNHVSSAILIKLINPCVDIVAMQRQILLPDGTAVPDPKEDLDRSHLDTSCFVFCESSYSILPLWAMMPPFLGPLCDRVIFQIIQAKGLRISWNDSKTLFFTSNYSQSYYSAAQPLPPRVNDPDLHFINNMLMTQSKQVIDRIGFNLEISKLL